MHKFHFYFPSLNKYYSTDNEILKYWKALVDFTATNVRACWITNKEYIKHAQKFITKNGSDKFSEWWDK